MLGLNPALYIEEMKALMSEMDDRGLSFLSDYTKRRYLKFLQLFHNNKLLEEPEYENYN